MAPPQACGVERQLDHSHKKGPPTVSGPSPGRNAPRSKTGSRPRHALNMTGDCFGQSSFNKENGCGTVSPEPRQEVSSRIREPPPFTGQSQAFYPCVPAVRGANRSRAPQSTWHDDRDLKAEAISSLGLERTMGEVIRFVPKSELERVRLIREARAIYDGIFPSTDSASEQRDDIKQLIASGRVV